MKDNAAWEIAEGDCLEVMRKLPDSSFDALITDPPFGIGKAYAAGRELHDDPLRYWGWLRPRYMESYRLVRPGGLLAVWQARPYLRWAWEWFGDGIHVYVGAKNFVQIRKKADITSAWDPIIMRYKGDGQALRPSAVERNLDFFVANTAKMVSDTKRIERRHPYPRPVDLVTEIVRNFTVPGGAILDPFSGSATTGIAALRTGRKFFGIEQEPSYVALGRERLSIEFPLRGHP